MVKFPDRKFLRLDMMRVQDAWFSLMRSDDSFYSKLILLNRLYNNFITPGDIPKIFPVPKDCALLMHLHNHVISLRTLIVISCDLLESRLKLDKIANFEQL